MQEARSQMEGPCGLVISNSCLYVPAALMADSWLLKMWSKLSCSTGAASAANSLQAGVPRRALFNLWANRPAAEPSILQAMIRLVPAMKLVNQKSRRLLLYRPINLCCYHL